jgi:HTH-type transcriptional repressor of NAD biosynthesis genes
MSRVGLVVGKFCPLHRGHQLLIDFARARSDHLILISYTKPDFPDYPTALRAQWLAALYPEATRLVVDAAVLAEFAAGSGTPAPPLPDNQASDDEQRAFVSWLCLTMLKRVVDVVFTSEDYGDGFAAALTRIFRDQADYAGTVEHVSFDRSRRIAPVSGTMIRRDPAAHRSSLPDIVAASLVRRVAILGGESSGKSTLAEALAQYFGTGWVHEYGRELWEQQGGHLVFEDMLAIAERQIAREEQALVGGDRWLFCDTTPLVTSFYSHAMFDCIDPRLSHLAERRYHHSFLCAPDFDFVQDGTRQDAAFRQRQHDWYLEALERSGQPFTLVTGSLDKRILEAAAVLHLHVRG